MASHHEEARSLGYKVTMNSVAPDQLTYCCADRRSQIVINYNGDVFKCTVDKFDSKDRLGVLEDGGVIAWRKTAFRAGMVSPLSTTNVIAASSCRCAWATAAKCVAWTAPLGTTAATVPRVRDEIAASLCARARRSDCGSPGRAAKCNPPIVGDSCEGR
jgi:hypothetical protein